MASVRRFGSCSSCQLRNSRRNGNGRSWKCRSVVPEWLLGSRIKAQGEEEDVWKRETGAAKAQAASQAGGVCPLYVSAFKTIFWSKNIVCVCTVRACVCVCVLRVDCWLLNQRLNKSCNVLAVGCGQLVSDISPFLWISLSHTTTVSLHHPPRVDDIIAGHCLFTNHPWLGLCLAEEFPVMCFLVWPLHSMDFTWEEWRQTKKTF